MSSDAKSLKTENGNPVPNSLGYRYTWIKASEPSIESLRQAFLDHESRILIPENIREDVHPEIRNRQSVIRSIAIKNVRFLADQKIYFSPNMNSVIGGRGSGKSTLLEYLRIIFRKDKSADIDDDQHYKQLVVEYLERFGTAKRVDIDRLLLDKLSDVLDEKQKHHKIKNLLQSMKNQDLIANKGRIWSLSKS